MKGRGYSTNIADHEPLLLKLALAVYGRLQCAGVATMTVEDILQEMRLTGLKAAELYDPSKGITFSAYLTRAAFNNINRTANKLIEEKIELGLTSTDAVNQDGESGDLLETAQLDQPVPSPEDMIIRNEEMAARIAKLGKTARLIVRELLAPSRGLRDTHRALRAQAEHAKKMGMNTGRVPLDINLSVIYRHYGIDRKERSAVSKEIREKLGVRLYD